MDGLDAQRLGIKRTVSVKRHESFRFGAKPFPEASAILHDALGLSYSYLSNCNSREVIVDVSPSTIRAASRERFAHPPLDGSRPEICFVGDRSAALSEPAQDCIQSPARPPSPTSPEGASESLRLLTRAST